MSHTDATQIAYQPDYEGTAEQRLLAMWSKPRIRAVMRALGYGVQVVEDMAFDTIVSTTLANAVGDALDQWGELVGEPRGAASDPEYRQFIQARMLVNRSSGNVEDLLEILDVATRPNVSVLHLDNFPSGFYLQVTRTAFLTDEGARRVARMMEDARPGGRHMSVIEAVLNGYGFTGDPDAAGFTVGPYSRLLEVI